MALRNNISMLLALSSRKPADHEDFKLAAFLQVKLGEYDDTLAAIAENQRVADLHNEGSKTDGS